MHKCSRPEETTKLQTEAEKYLMTVEKILGKGLNACSMGGHPTHQGCSQRKTCFQPDLHIKNFSRASPEDPGSYSCRRRYSLCYSRTKPSGPRPKVHERAQQMLPPYPIMCQLLFLDWKWKTVWQQKRRSGGLQGKLSSPPLQFLFHSVLIFICQTRGQEEKMGGLHGWAPQTTTSMGVAMEESATFMSKGNKCWCLTAK